MSGELRNSTLPLPVLAAAVVAVMAALYGADSWLAALERREMAHLAGGYYREGQALLKSGDPAAAAERFRLAFGNARANRTYGLALADALLAAGKPEQARTILAELLETDSNSGPANRLMARQLVSAGQWAAAESYYHRAIYGSWPAEARLEPLQVRLELARMLAGHGSSQALLSELLALQNSPALQPDMQRQLAGLFLQAGSATRAAAAWQQTLQRDPADLDAYAGLGRAEMILGNYSRARAALASALRLKPNHPEALRQMAIAGLAERLDPTPRRLPPAEKLRRGGELLAMELDLLSGCSSPVSPSGAWNDALARARRLQRENRPGASPNEAAEARLDAAGDLWKTRPSGCGNQSDGAAAIDLIVRKLEQ